MVSALQQTYELRIPMLERLSATLEAETKAALDNLNHVDRIAFRVKGVKSFVDKATDPERSPAYDVPLVEVEDQIAGRVIVFFRSDLGFVVSKLLNSFSRVEETHKKPAKDEEFGYESEHFIFVIPPHLTPTGWQDISDRPTTFEIQVRTLFMHAYAEPQHDLGYKSSLDLPSNIRRELAWIAASSWGADEAYERVHQWSINIESKK